MALLLYREDTERWNLTLSVAILKTTILRVRSVIYGIIIRQRRH